jgi:hypothetical protein
MLKESNPVKVNRTIKEENSGIVGVRRGLKVGLFFCVFVVFGVGEGVWEVLGIGVGVTVPGLGKPPVRFVCVKVGVADGTSMGL